MIIDSKSFQAKPSKFQSNPHKHRNKIIILDESEEQELNKACVSLNNHMSQESISKIKK